MRKTLKIITVLIVVLISIAAARTTFLYFRAKGDIERVPSIFGYKPLTILSNSMRPTFSAGDVVIINVDKSPRINEVVTFKHPQGMLVTHRIIGTTQKSGKTYYLSKGDNNNVSDGILIPKSSIIGVEVFVIPNIGYVTKFLSGPFGVFIFIELPILTLIIIEIFKWLGIIETKKTVNTNKVKAIKE